MNQEDVLFLAELTRIARRPDAVKRFATDRELLNRMAEVRSKYSKEQWTALSKQAEEK